MATTKRKTRSDKFPLTLHPTGQYCKKLKTKSIALGKIKNRHLNGISNKRRFSIMARAKL
jgi:hypothetical protein